MSAPVVWHDLECGGYQADLGLWRELAERELGVGGGPLLDVGAGSGRVTLDLARRGHSVDALDREQALLDALSERAEGLAVRTVCADARSLELERRDYRLCIVPMQTIQLLDGPRERLAFLGRAREHLRPGGLLALAIVTEVEPFDRAAGDSAPSPEVARIGAHTYVSRPIRVACDRDGAIEIERERSVTSSTRTERDLVRLAGVSAEQLEAEGREAGFRAEPARPVSETADHAGSVVVMLRA